MLPCWLVDSRASFFPWAFFVRHSPALCGEGIQIPQKILETSDTCFLCRTIENTLAKNQQQHFLNPIKRHQHKHVLNVHKAAFGRANQFCGAHHWHQCHLTSKPPALSHLLIRIPCHREQSFRQAGKEYCSSSIKLLAIADGTCQGNGWIYSFLCQLLQPEWIGRKRRIPCALYRRRSWYTSGGAICFFPGFKEWISWDSDVCSFEIKNWFYNTGWFSRIQRDAFWALWRFRNICMYELFSPTWSEVAYMYLLSRWCHCLFIELWTASATAAADVPMTIQFQTTLAFLGWPPTFVALFVILLVS